MQQVFGLAKHLCDFRKGSPGSWGNELSLARVANRAGGTIVLYPSITPTD